MAADEALFASIAMTGIATVITNPRLADNPICAVNAAFRRLTGYRDDELIGRNCRLLAGMGTDQPGREIMRAAIAEASPAVAELVNFRRDGTPFRNAVMIAPLFDDRGRLTYFIGSQMEVEEAAAQRDEAAAARAKVAALTPRQREVLQLMARGLLNKQIAGEMQLSEKTVKMHRAALLGRLGARISSDAIRVAVQAGL